MQYSIQRLCNVRVAVVLVERRQLAPEYSNRLIADLQLQFQYPVMLVAANQGQWLAAKAVAQFDATPYLFDLLAMREEIEWFEVPEHVEAELPF